MEYLSLESAHEAAVEAAVYAGALLLAHRADAVMFRTKADLASSADTRSDEAIKTSLRLTDPTTPFFSEESQGDCPRSGTYWLVDALDGTLNYYRRGDDFCISIALIQDRRVVVAVIYQVAVGRLYSAIAGSGARCATIRDPLDQYSVIGDFTIIRVDESIDSLATQFFFDWGKDTEDGSAHRRVFELITKLDRVSFYPQVGGSAALAAITVTWGRSDGYVALKIEDVDVAAAHLICIEAGAVVTDRFGNHWTPEATSFVVGTRRTHPILLEIVRSIE